MTSSHSLDRLCVQFDDENLVANAGLILPATLAQHLGLEELYRHHVRLGDAPGRPNDGIKAMTLIHSAITGGDCIDDADILRSGMTEAGLGHALRAPSTLGTFLRSFFLQGGCPQPRRRGSGRALPGVGGGGRPGRRHPHDRCRLQHLRDLRPGQGGGSGFTYNHVRGYRPLIDVAEDQVCTPGSGAARHTPGEGPRASWRRPFPGSGRPATAARSSCGPTPGSTTTSWSMPVSAKEPVARSPPRCRLACRRSSTPSPRRAGSPSRTSWTAAAVSETTYTLFLGTLLRKKAKSTRLIVRRVPPTPGSQLALYVEHGYHAFVTNRAGEMLELEADHRRHAVVEATIRDLKYGVGLNHLPSGRFGANGAWLAFNVMAHNLIRWAAAIGLGGGAPTTTKTFRRRMVALPGRLARSGRRVSLHLPQILALGGPVHRRAHGTPGSAHHRLSPAAGKDNRSIK